MRYGDYDNVTKDAATLREIMGRQGQTLLYEVLADHVGQVCVKFKLPENEAKIIRDDMLNNLKSELLERT